MAEAVIEAGPTEEQQRAAAAQAAASVASGEAKSAQSGAGETKVPAGVYVTTPVELHEKLEAEATAAGKSVAGFVRELLGQRYGLDLTKLAEAPRRKYATTEEKRAAQKAKNKERSELYKMLMAEYKAKLAAAAAAAGAGTGGAA